MGVAGAGLPSSLLAVAISKYLALLSPAINIANYATTNL
jgi:hypothetical protein